MMKLDELAPRAGKEIRDATRGLQPPGIMEVRSSRRRRNGMSAAFATFVGTLAVIGTVVLWPTGGETESVSPPHPTTTIETETPAAPAIREYRLLDGRIATLETDPPLTLQGYSFFIDTPDIDAPDVGGGRHVTVAQGDPSDIAATESAEEEATLSGTTTLWRADRAGQPLFLSVDLDPWVVWLNVGNETSRPSTDALLQLAQRLTGTTDERGVVLERLELDYHELHLSGSDDELVTLRIGTCFNESVPSSETVDDPRWGQVIRSEQRAAWCIGDGELEVIVHGPKAFVDSMVAGIDVGINGATHSPTTSATSATTTTSAIQATGPWSVVADHPVVGRTFPAVVWTGSEVVIWGGEKPSEGAWHADGAAFNPATGTWRELADSPLAPRSEHVAVWTGEEVIICCGRIEGTGASAGAYDPEADQWREISAPPIGPAFAEAVWTGEEMLVFGGVGIGGAPNLTGAAAYNPDTDSWRRLADLPYGLERTADAVYGDGVVFAWPSGFGSSPPQSSPLSYHIESDTWTPLPPRSPEMTPDTPSLVWTGNQLIAWGLSPGFDDAQGLGVAFQPDTRDWEVLPAAPLEPTDRWEGTAASQATAWTGSEVVVWTGYVGTDANDPTSRVVAYDPSQDTWRELEPAPIPARGLRHEPMIWTGSQLITYTDPMLLYTP